MHLLPVNYQCNNFTYFGAKNNIQNFKQKLINYNDVNGKQLLNSPEIDMLVKSKIGFNNKPIKNFYRKVLAILNNPEEIKEISMHKEKGFSVWAAVQEPLNSTIKANPKLFK